jgi:hypothetical protein
VEAQAYRCYIEVVEVCTTEIGRHGGS